LNDKREFIGGEAVKDRGAGRISGLTTSRCSVAAIIAVAASTEGRHEIVGLGVGPSEAEPFRSSFIKGLTKRWLRGAKLVISDCP